MSNYYTLPSPTATAESFYDYTHTHTKHLVLVEVNHNSSSDLSSPELLHTFRHLAHTSDLTDRLQQASPRIIQGRSSILHRTHQSTDDSQVLEREEVWVGAQRDGAGGRESDGHDGGADAVADILDGVWQTVSGPVRDMTRTRNETYRCTLGMPSPRHHGRQYHQQSP